MTDRKPLALARHTRSQNTSQTPRPGSRALEVNVRELLNYSRSGHAFPFVTREAVSTA